MQRHRFLAESIARAGVAINREKLSVERRKLVAAELARKPRVAQRCRAHLRSEVRMFRLCSVPSSAQAKLSDRAFYHYLTVLV